MVVDIGVIHLLLLGHPHLEFFSCHLRPLLILQSVFTQEGKRHKKENIVGKYQQATNIPYSFETKKPKPNPSKTLMIYYILFIEAF